MEFQLEFRGSESNLALDEASGLEDYELVKVIGRGSYSTVFMVEHIETRQLFAMKVISKRRMSGEKDLRCIHIEKRVLQAAMGSEFLVGLYSSLESSKRFFFILEIARGGDLMFHMQRMGKLAEDDARFYAAEICLALNFLHEKGIIYRYRGTLGIDKRSLSSSSDLIESDFAFLQRSQT